MPRTSIFPPMTGGPAVVAELLLSRCRIKLILPQAQGLWTECRAVLITRDDEDTAKECEASRDGRLDTYPREGVMDALAHVLTARSWPVHAAPTSEVESFVNALKSAFKQRGYHALVPPPQKPGAFRPLMQDGSDVTHARTGHDRQRPGRESLS